MTRDVQPGDLVQVTWRSALYAVRQGDEWCFTHQVDCLDKGELGLVVATTSLKDSRRPSMTSLEIAMVINPRMRLGWAIMDVFIVTGDEDERR